MEIQRDLVATCPASELFTYVEDLDQYTVWMPLVHTVELAPDGAAWNVELRAKVGPFARSKRLRMVRSVHVPNREVVFERAETDGRHHAPWVMRALLEEFESSDEGSPPEVRTRLTMTLRYGGSLWTGGVMERVLDDQVRRGSEALLELVATPPTH